MLYVLLDVDESVYHLHVYVLLRPKYLGRSLDIDAYEVSCLACIR